MGNAFCRKDRLAGELRYSPQRHMFSAAGHRKSDPAGAENRIRPVAETEALALMLNNTWRPGNREEMNLLLDMVEQVVTKINVYEMSCTRDAEAAELSYKVMKGM